MGQWYEKRSLRFSITVISNPSLPVLDFYSSIWISMRKFFVPFFSNDLFNNKVHTHRTGMGFLVSIQNGNPKFFIPGLCLQTFFIILVLLNVYLRKILG